MMQLVLDLPPRNEQIAFNRSRWSQLAADPSLMALPNKIETNGFGQIIMNPPPTGEHSFRQSTILLTLSRLLGQSAESAEKSHSANDQIARDGQPLTECPISTIDGVKSADVGWFSNERFAQVRGQQAFEIAPEICVEVLSPGNTRREMMQKKKLYFEAGAQEVWFCRNDGTMEFFTVRDTAETASGLVPDFPRSLADSMP